MTNDKANNSVTVSVIIPAYNVRDYIGRAIDSVLAQIRQPDEIIVVDDGSTDDTAEKVKSFGDKVNYIYQENRGVSAARNTGIKAASSEWIAFLDGDDEWLPQYLEKQTELIKRNPDLMWSAGNYLRCLCNENRCNANLNATVIRKLLKNKDYFENYFYMSRKEATGCIDTVMIRREVFGQVGMFDEKYVLAEDTDMFWRITYRWPKVGFVAEALSIYHMARPGAASQAPRSSSITALSQFLQKHRKLAAEHNQSEQFDLLAGRLVTSWIRSLLFQNDPHLTKELMTIFNDVLSTHFKAFVRLLMICPKATAVTCHMISKIVRTLHLRKKIVRRPGR